MFLYKELPTNSILNSDQNVSVIICAKDEYKNLTRLIPILLNQNYKHYQVVIVDDHSQDQIEVLWDVANYVGRVGLIKKDYNEIFPSANIKYELNEKNFLRFATSLTQTLPEFKELAPFEYVSPTGRVTRGDPDLEKSDVFNIDLKWEFFPNKSELISDDSYNKMMD